MRSVFAREERACHDHQELWARPKYVGIQDEWRENKMESMVYANSIGANSSQLNLC
jgi:hypothetical protein